MVMGVFFLTTNDGFDTAPYRYVFGSIHRPEWGLVFLISGLLALVAGSLPDRILLASTILLMTAVGTWAFMWLAAAIAGVVPRHAPVAWLIVFLTITAAVKRRGIRG
jgi:hypothetical protein